LQLLHPEEVVVSTLATVLAGLSCVIGQQEPGAIAVVGGNDATVTFSLTADAPYQIDFATNLCNVWHDRARTNPAVPMTTYTAREYGDVNGDGEIDTNDVRCFLEVLGPIGPLPHSTPCMSGVADLNDDGQVDELDVPGFAEALVHAFPAEGAVLFVEGLAPSNALGDAAISLLTDPDENGVFTPTATAPATMVEILISPTTGEFGTPISVTMTPAAAPLAFDGNISATWNVVFEPVAGAPSSPFTIRIRPSEFRESSGSQATVIAGESRAIGAIGLEQFALPGTLAGNLVINIGTIRLSKPFSFAPTNGPLLTAISYDALTAQPFLGPTPESLEIVTAGNGDGADENLLAGMTPNHLAAVLELNRNPITESESPSELTVTLISINAFGTTIQSIDNVILHRDDALLTPDHVKYHSDFNVPIVLVDTQLDPAEYSLVVPLYAVDGGRVAILPEGF
jgi:hypothetical protein